ncbi:alpha/beta hydrolase [Thalassotalea psychrophila]|uniref:Alpha/beta hydrolase n=1 Tax=Thalassotalea psychrophila TaxID=3065647 RepID=A0ABY9TUJ8_9GAMM|nr:alpha/beta hydrolase [Colwelliaceae bacterium SQ149]
MLSWRLITIPLKLLLTIIVLYLLWVLIAFRDIPVAELEQKYGGNNLQTTSIDGVNIRYKVEGNGPPIVLIHSHFFTMRQWQAWVDILKDDFTVIRFDLTSHGLTGPDPTGDYSRKRSTVLLNGLMQHIGINHFNLVGSSTGGGIAYTYAATHPEQINKLVLINTPGMPKVTNKYMKKELPTWGGFIFYLLPESLFSDFLKAPIIDDALVTDAMVKEFHQMYRRSGNRMAEYQRMRGYEKGDVTSILEKITAPTLIMWGEKNPQLPVEHVEQFQQKLRSSPNVQTIIYPDIGHVIPIENPQQSALDVRKFFKQITIRMNDKTNE